MNANTAIDPRDERDFETRLIAGDAAAFTEMMRKHNRRLYRTARAILRDDAEAEDALQEAYLSAYRALPGFRADAKLSTWLVRIVANEALGRLRKKKRSAEVIVLDDGAALYSEATMYAESPTEAPDRAAMRGETRRLIEARIDALPAQFRTVFILRELEEMSVEDVAASLDIPVATVRSRHFRARSLLRESLSRDMDVALEGVFAFDGARCDRIVANVLAALPNQKPPSGGTP